MLPPPSPLAHRRTRPVASPILGSPSCVRHKMSLSKADTFHQSSSPSATDDPVVSIAHLSKRSTTCTRSSFASWLYSGREAAADVLADFEQTFSGARGPRPAARRRSAREFDDQLLAKAQRRASSPVDSGIGSSIGSPSEKSLSRTFDKTLDLASNKDSALGGSVTASVTSESLIQGWLIRCLWICRTSSNSCPADTNRTKAPSTNRSSSGSTPLTIIRYQIPSIKKNNQPLLSSFARRQIYKRLYAPLLQEARFEEFRPIVAGTRKNKNLRCLRDIEQSLINQPVVSTFYPLANSQSNSSRKTLTVTPSQYRSFGELTIQLVIDTYQHLSESEQRRPTDRAYENGYFLDLVQQVQQLAAHIGSSDTVVEDGTQPTFDDEVTLEGGISETGNLAELVRWKNGEGISLRTGLPYLAMAATKRTASMAGCDDAQLSARRKKGVEYPEQHLPCPLKDCGKVFSRQCDLAKHEKTHTRPYRCPEPGCKYHENGLPTEKELDRHRNDKHNDKPKLFACEWCEFKTKRESNCKQHMEKKHGYKYQRSKGNKKSTDLTPGPTPQTPALAYPSAHESPMTQASPFGVPSSSSSMQESPFEQPIGDFNFAGFQPEYPDPLFPRRATSYNHATQFDTTFQYSPNSQLNLNTDLTGNTFGSGAYPTPASGVQQRFTPRTPARSLITPSPMSMVEHNVPYFGFNNNADMPTPDSNQSHSQNASFVQDMGPPAPVAIAASVPMNSMNMNFNNFDMGMDDAMGADIFPGEFQAPGNFQVQDDFQLFGQGTSAFTYDGAQNATLFPEMHNVDENPFTAEAFEGMEGMNFEADPIFFDADNLN